MKKTLGSLRGDLIVMLEKYELLYEDMAVVTDKEEITITFTRKNDTRQFQRFIHYLNRENLNYTAYFCPKTKRIKVTAYTEWMMILSFNFDLTDFTDAVSQICLNRATLNWLNQLLCSLWFLLKINLCFNL